MIELAVVCAACETRAVHEVGAILFDDDAREDADDADAWTRAVYVALSLSCPACGAVDQHRVEPASGRALEVDGSVVREGRAALSDGTVIYSPSDGIRHLRARAEEKPRDAKRWRALGNFAIRADRSEEAFDAWRRGAALDGEFECALAVAVHAVARVDADAGSLVSIAMERLVHAEPQRRPLQSAQVAELIRKLPHALTISLDGESLDTAVVRDWSRFGEQLALASALNVLRA